MLKKEAWCRSLKTYQEVMQSLVETAHALSLHVIGIMESPIRGQKGNREFFLYAVKKLAFRRR